MRFGAVAKRTIQESSSKISTSFAELLYRLSITASNDVTSNWSTVSKPRKQTLISLKTINSALSNGIISWRLIIWCANFLIICVADSRLQLNRQESRDVKNAADAEWVLFYSVRSHWLFLSRFLVYKATVSRYLNRFLCSLIHIC